MDIRFANNGDIPGMLELLRQAGQVHHEIRPDIFRTGCQKYDAEQHIGTISLNVWSGNHRAMGFYEKMGMSPRSVTMDLIL